MNEHVFDLLTIRLVGLTSHYVTQRGKIAEKRMCVAKRTHRYARHEGEKRDDFPDVRPSELLCTYQDS